MSSINPKESLKADSTKIREEFFSLISKKKLFEVNTYQNKYYFRNKELADIVEKKINLKNLEDIESLLIKRSAFSFNSTQVEVVDIDNDQHLLTVLRASLVDNWPMGTHYWIRDNAIIADRLLNSNLFNKKLEANFKNLATKLLRSALVIISSKSQLERFKNIATLDKELPLPKASEWPHIFLSIKENLNGSKTEPWQHKQDAWQMLAYFTLKAIENNSYKIEDLTDKMGCFFGITPLFLKRISAWTYESAGSWEELIAKRSSVLVWEYAFLKKLQNCNKELLLFFEEQVIKYLKIENYKILPVINEILPLTEKTLVKRLPMEAPDYPLNSIKYRNEDASLIYALELNTYEELAKSMNKSNKWVEDKESELFSKIEALRDTKTGAIKRYKNDSYQRNAYFRKEVVIKLKEYFEGVSGEASSDSSFEMRNKLVPEGREACWTHFLWQLVLQYKKRSKSKPEYLDNVIDNFYFGLSSFLGEEEYTVSVNSDCNISIKHLEAFQLPECFISDNKDDEYIIFPSPNTPLQWSIGEAISAFSALKSLLEETS